MRKKILSGLRQYRYMICRCTSEWHFQRLLNLTEQSELFSHVKQQFQAYFFPSVTVSSWPLSALTAGTPHSPHLGAADTEIKVLSGENTELKCSPFTA